MNLLIKILLGCFTLSGPLLAQTYSISKNNEYFSIETPKGWKTRENFLGFPLLLRGPFDKKDGRSSLSVTMTGVADPGFDISDLKASEEIYYKGRRTWLNKKEGTWKKSLPFEVLKSNDGNKIYTIGFEYIFGEVYFIERTYFYFCPKSMVFLKLLLTQKDATNHMHLLNTIKNAKCVFRPSITK